MPYNAKNAVAYAKKWANGRNPAYIDMTQLGGDCTNFVSQCLAAGGLEQGENWRYVSENERTPAWSDADSLCAHLLESGAAQEVFTGEDMQPGDVVFLSTPEGDLYHALLVVDQNAGKLYIAAHTNDAWMRPLGSYLYWKARFVHML